MAKPSADWIALNSTPETYNTPALLRSIQILDLLELGGTTNAAATALCLSQPTVSRRVQHLVLDLGLKASSDRCKKTLRYTDNLCLQHLRQACQSHRLQAGAWRVGSCPWHQSVVQPLQPWILVPSRFRHPTEWQELVVARAIDAAVVSGLDVQLALQEPLEANSHGLSWEDCLLFPITRSPLGLLSPPGSSNSPERWSSIALPPQQFAPGLASVVRQQQSQCLHADKSCHDPQAWALWLQQQNRPVLATPAWALTLHPHLPGWRWLPWSGDTSEHHWLLVLRSVWEAHPALQCLLLLLRTGFGQKSYRN